MMEVLIGGYDFSGFIIKTDFQYGKEVRQGIFDAIFDAISYTNSKVLNNINLNLLSVQMVG